MSMPMITKEGEVYEDGRSAARARELTGMARAHGDPVGTVRTTTFGYIYPESILETPATEVTPEAPTRNGDDNEVTVPTVTGVNYSHTGVTPIPEGGLVVTATAEPGYRITGTDSWSFTFTEPEPEPELPGDGGEGEAGVQALAFSPEDHSVAEVQEYLDNADEEERQRVLDAETEGKARKTLLADNGRNEN